MILRKDGRVSPAPGGLESSPHELPFPLGARIAGCTLLEVAGAGPLGTVYLASSEIHHGHVALKALCHGVSSNRGAARELNPEEKSPLSHPNLAAVYGCGEEGGVHYYVRTFLRGDSLERVILDLKRGQPELPHLAPLQVGRDGRLHPRFYYAVARIFAEVAGALQLAHERGLAHGRIHPGNLIFSPTGRLVLTDFAGLAEDGRGGRTGAADPSLPYRAPEQLDAFHEGKPLPQDPQTEVYALGAVLHHLVFREPPSQAGEDSQGLEAALEDLAPEFRAVIGKAIARDREERYPSARALRESLKRLSNLSATGALSGPPRRPLVEAPEASPRPRAQPDEASSAAPVSSLPAVPLIPPEGLLPPRAHPPPLEETEVTEEPEEARQAAAAILEEIGATGEESAAEAPPAELARRAAGRKGAGRAVLAASLAFLALFAAAAWLSLHFHKLSSLFRSKAVELTRGSASLQSAVSALISSDHEQAAAALASARWHLDQGRLEHDSALEGKASEAKKIERLEKHLRFLSADPVLGGLFQPHAAVRAASLEKLGLELAEELRPSTDLLPAAGCLWDDDVEVRCRAIGLFGRPRLVPMLLEAFPIGSGKAALRLDGRTFFALYQALVNAALQGSQPAIAAVEAIDLDALERLEAALDRAAGSRRAEPAGQAAAAELAVPPNLVIEAAGPAPGSWVREWIRAHARFGGGSVLRELPRLERRRDLLGEVIAALEALGHPRAVEELSRLLRERYLEHGARLVGALARAGAVRELARLAAEPFPLPLRVLAAEKAAAQASGLEIEAVAQLAERHPDEAVRRTALAGLAERNLLLSHPRPLLAALGDPELKPMALELLAGMPARGAIPCLLEILKSSDAALRARATALIVQAGDPALLFPLIQQLFETSRQLRRATLEALRSLQDDRALALAVAILDPDFPGLEELARALLELPESRRREDPAILVLALQELFGLRSPDGDPAAVQEIRRAILIARLGKDPQAAGRQVPERIRDFIECPK